VSGKAVFTEGEAQGTPCVRSSQGVEPKRLARPFGTMLKDLPDFDHVGTEWTKILQEMMGKRK